MSRAGQKTEWELLPENFDFPYEEEVVVPNEFIDPETVGCELAEELAELDDEILTDSYDYMIRSRNNFFTASEGNECIECVGTYKHYRAKCTGCGKNPASEIFN